MTRPLRLDFARALHHITSRGDRREDIYLNNDDRRDWLDVLGNTCQRFNWVVHAFCQMSNHYHLLLETIDGNLARRMRQLNGEYTQGFNRRHKLVGHLFQGRYKAILVQKESYLLELTRYIVLNPLRVRMVTSLDDWPWSSFPFSVGAAPPPDWLDLDVLLGQFVGECQVDRGAVIAAYRKFVMAGKGLPSPMLELRHQLLLGDDTFVERHKAALNAAPVREVSKAQRRAVALTLAQYQRRHVDRDEAMARAYLSGAYTMAMVAAHFGVHSMTVSRAVRTHENAGAQATDASLDVRQLQPGASDSRHAGIASPDTGLSSSVRKTL